MDIQPIIDEVKKRFTHWSFMRDGLEDGYTFRVWGPREDALVPKPAPMYYVYQYYDHRPPDELQKFDSATSAENYIEEVIRKTGVQSGRYFKVIKGNTLKVNKTEKTTVAIDIEDE